MLVTCDCGKRLRVRDDLAGKRIKCPACGQPVVVKADEELPAPPPAKQRSAVQEKVTSRKAKPVADPPVEDEDEGREARPKEKKKPKKAKGSSPLVLVLVAFAAFILLGGGLATAYFLIEGTSTSSI